MNTDARPTKSGWDSAENLIDGADGEQSLRLDGRKVCNIKRVGISQAKRNRATVCVLLSIHLPLTREARTWCEARDSADGEPAERSLKGKGGGAKQGIVGMILRELWGWWVGGDGDRFTEKREVLLR